MPMAHGSNILLITTTHAIPHAHTLAYHACYQRLHLITNTYNMPSGRAERLYITFRCLRFFVELRY